MNKKTVISATDNTIRKLKVLAKKKESVRSKLAVTAREKEDVRSKLAVTAEELAVTAKKKESVRSKLAVTAREKEDVRSKLAVTAKQLATTAEEKEDVRSKLAVTAKELKVKAEDLAAVAREKETVRSKLVVVAENLATTAQEKEDVRRKLAVTAENLDIKAKLLATTAEERESIRRRLVVTAKEKESIRSKLAVTAKELKVKAEDLAAVAREKEDVRSKLAVVAENLATTAQEKESIRERLAVIAKQLAVTAEEKESIRRKLEVTAEELKLKAKNLAVTAKEKEDVRSKLAVTAKNLATTAEEKEDVRRKLAVTAGNLARAKARDEAMLASMGDGLVVVDRDMRTVLINRAAEAATGWKSHEVLGKVWTEVIVLAAEDGKKLPPQKSPSFLAIQDEKTYTSTTSYFYTRKDKTTFPVAITVSPFKVGNEFIGATIVFRDVTREREIDKAKTEFVSLASHELRTPLTAIDGIVSMILGGEYGDVNKNLKQPLEDVNISSERLVHLVNDLLNLSRIQAGKMKYTLSEFPIADVITEAVHLLQPLSGKKELRFMASKLEPIAVQGDLDKVKEVLNNLIGNSLKFTDKGKITISVKSEEDKINVYIADTGIGIAKEDQNKLFGKFAQLESATGKPAGTGLGLHISREMVRKMGGELWIEKSEVGIGSTFVFSLPRSKSQLAQKVKKEIEKETKVVDLITKN